VSGLFVGVIEGLSEGDLVVGGALVGLTVGEEEGLDELGLADGDSEGLDVGDSLGGSHTVSFATQPILPSSNLQQTGTGLSHAPTLL